jgi:hypothetical protein
MPSNFPQATRGALCLALAAACAAAPAAPSDYVYVPYADPGVWRAAWDFGFERPREGGREIAHALSIGVAPTARWFTALYAGWYAEPQERHEFYGGSWTNQFQLTGAGGPFSAGVLLDVARPREREEGTLVTLGPLLQWDAERWQFNLNPLFVKATGAEASSPTQLKYQWQAKRLWRAGWELGAQGFGHVGPWNHWSPAREQEHVAGPAVFGKLAGGERPLRLDSAWLFGIGAGSPRHMLRLRLQQEF